MPDNTVTIYFPIKGYKTNLTYVNQEPLSSAILSNCWIRDVFENRARGGQRAGLAKASDTEISGGSPIFKMVSIINTYIPAE